jgi:hypothetical protein
MPILTATRGTNADLLPQILELYVPEGSVIADVTYGKGTFWKQVDISKYDLRPTDLMTGVDFRHLPYSDASIDVFVLDPPFMHTGATVHVSINSRYHNENNTSHESVIRLYAAGILEAARVLKKKGVLIVKAQDECESGRQRFSHVELINLLELFGFEVLDLFVLVRNGIPMIRQPRQHHARKNHSYALVGRFRR